MIDPRLSPQQTHTRTRHAPKTCARPFAALLLAALSLSISGCAPPATPTTPAPSGAAGTAWGRPGGMGAPSFVFQADGTARGHDGCNGMGGTWREDGSTIFLEEMLTSVMHCGGMDTWLSGAETAVIDGSTITFSTTDGRVIGSLPQAKLADFE